MPYTPNPAWQDFPNTTTPITAAKLQNIDDGVDDAHDLIDDHIADTVDAHDATAISYAGNTNLSATTVEAALDELDNEKQPLDTELTLLAGLAETTDNVIQSVAGAWASRTPAQLKATLALAKADVGLGSVDNTADTAKPVSTAQQTALNLKADLNTPSFKGTRTTTLASANGAFTVIPWNAETWDTHNGHSTVTNTSRYTVQSGWAGLYLVSASIHKEANWTNALIAVGIYLNGAEVIDAWNFGPATVYRMNTRAVTLNCAVGDYIEVVWYQDSGGSKSLQPVSGVYAGCEINWLRPQP